MYLNSSINCTLNNIFDLDYLNCLQTNLKIPLKSNQILILLIVIFIFMFICLIYCFKKSWDSIFNSNKNQLQSKDEVDLDLELFNNLDSFQYLFNKFQHLEYPYNRLIFIRDLGIGEFGRVVQAKAPKLNQPRTPDLSIHLPQQTTININDAEDYQIVAVKMLKKNEQRKFLKRNLIKEAFLMAQFNHPNLIRLLGISITPHDHIYLLFEYMSKGDLNAFLRFRSPSNQHSSAFIRKETHLSELNLLKFAKQIADGMQYLSNLNFVHRDLATRNCLINDELIVKISDFGLSQKLSIDQDNKDVKSFKQGGWREINKEEEKLIKNERLPIRWTSIEALLFNHYSIKSDVWSFGVLLWELYSYGAKPYSEIEENRQVIKFICDGNRLKKPELASKSLFKLMMQCWSKDPNKRPTFEKILNIFKSIELEFMKKEKKAAKSLQKSLKKNVRDKQFDKDHNNEENV